MGGLVQKHLWSLIHSLGNSGVFHNLLGSLVGTKLQFLTVVTGIMMQVLFISFHFLSHFPVIYLCFLNFQKKAIYTPGLSWLLRNIKSYMFFPLFPGIREFGLVLENYIRKPIKMDTGWGCCEILKWSSFILVNYQVFSSLTFSHPCCPLTSESFTLW